MAIRCIWLPGSSPLTRGKHHGGISTGGGAGLIPAHAGKTFSSRRVRIAWWAHPRSRGENRRAVNTSSSAAGSSPLTRGKRHEVRGQCGASGLIPAHAGKTTKAPQCDAQHWAHPRSRGENVALSGVIAKAEGSSPLTRGKRRWGKWTPPHGGLIPAHAGKTYLAGMSISVVTAHPRSRGENKNVFLETFKFLGSSPLTRGKPVSLTDRVRHLGLIPAHAGKTTETNHGSINKRAHPRSRGENLPTIEQVVVDEGSSPLTRGKRTCPCRVRR